ncbi:MAG: hypothetical protein AB7S80_06535 [Rhizobiaceae bacterium]
MLGIVVGVVAMLAAGEVYLRLVPPTDLRPFLIDSLSETGPYVADPVIGADYRSYDALHALYVERLDELAAANAGRPVWMLFGNSFVNARGMLGDTAQARIASTQFVYLRRNEILALRVAQFRRLLEHGERPVRVVFTFVPLDLHGIALHAPADLAVNAGGALGRRNHAPSFLPAWFWENSRLSLAAWTRSGRNSTFPGYRAVDVMRPQPPAMATELDRIFGEIARLAGAYGVAATIVAIPNREQVMGDPNRVAQDALSVAATRAGLDYVDTTAAFTGQAEPQDLFIADGHFNDRGNAILLDALLAHLGEPAGR